MFRTKTGCAIVVLGAAGYLFKTSEEVLLTVTSRNNLGLELMSSGLWPLPDLLQDVSDNCKQLVTQPASP